MEISGFKDTQRISGTALSSNVCNIRRIFIEQSGNIPIFNIPGTLFGNIPRNFVGNFFRIFWEYIMGMFQEYSTNIYFTWWVSVGEALRRIMGKAIN